MLACIYMKLSNLLHIMKPLAHLVLWDVTPGGRCVTLDTLHCIHVLSEVTAPEAVGHLIASYLGIQYDEALNLLSSLGV
jgi:hypothetical protein